MNIQDNDFGELYTLPSKEYITPGGYFKVGGPHDTHGVVLSQVRYDQGTYWYRVRGTKKKIYGKDIN